jgi:hypothetical protein
MVIVGQSTGLSQISELHPQSDLCGFSAHTLKSSGHHHGL